MKQRCAVLSLVFSACFALLPHAKVSAQVGIGAGVGVAGGTFSRAVAELNGSANLAGRLNGTAGIHALATLALCDATWPGSFQCGYMGVGIFAGPSYSVIRSRRLHVALGATGGIFWRTGDGFAEERSTTWSVGTDADVRISRAWSFQAGVHRRTIRDGFYRELFGEDIRLTSVTAGMMVLLKDRKSVTPEVR